MGKNTHESIVYLNALFKLKSADTLWNLNFVKFQSEFSVNTSSG